MLAKKKKKKKCMLLVSSRLARVCETLTLVECLGAKRAKGILLESFLLFNELGLDRDFPRFVDSVHKIWIDSFIHFCTRSFG